MASVLGRLADELDDLTERIAERIITDIPEYHDDPVAQAILRPYVRLNLDQVMLALRGVTTTSTTARYVVLADAIVTGLSLQAVQRTFEIGREEVVRRLVELNTDGEDLGEPLARFAEAAEMVGRAVAEEYLATKARLGSD